MSFVPDSSGILMQRARDPDPVVRAAVAADPAAPPELLYYLASDSAEAVRVAAAANMATPVQSAPAQVMDDSRLVRAALARKLARVLPQLGEGASRTTAMTAIEKLCGDTAVEVRLALAVTLQDTAFLPAPLAIRLAEDSERAVASPVLRFCLSLTDDDLVALVRRARHDWIPVEVASRPVLSNAVATAVWESGNAEAATLLLANAQADTSPAVIDAALEEAPVVTAYQAPLVRHAALQPAQLSRLATFVDGDLLGILDARAQLSRGELSDVSAIVRRRLDWARSRQQGSTGRARALALQAAGQLDDAALSDAIAWGDRDFVMAALAQLAGTDEALVVKVLEHQSPKGVTALCWKAGISMRTCRQVQIRVARIPQAKALYARGGFDYPLSDADMIWQLEFYGIVRG